MWLLSKNGAWSAVAKEDGMVVRSRLRRDAEVLAEAVFGEGGVDAVMHTPGRDYAYRVVMSHAAWARFCAQEAQMIDYDNFKDEVARTQGHLRADAYGNVWVALYWLQAHEEQVEADVPETPGPRKQYREPPMEVDFYGEGRQLAGRDQVPWRDQTPVQIAEALSAAVAVLSPKQRVAFLNGYLHETKHLTKHYGLMEHGITSLAHKQEPYPTVKSKDAQASTDAGGTTDQNPGSAENNKPGSTPSA